MLSPASRVVLALILASLALAPPFAQASDAALTPTSAAAVTFSTTDTLVTWTSGAAPADSYRVYGVQSGGTLAFLDEVPAMVGIEAGAAVVDAGYESYAVTAVADGVESAPRNAVTLTGVPCLKIILWTTPPAASITCLPSVGLILP